MEEQREMEAQKDAETQVVACSKCGGVIARHEALVIVDGGNVRRSTLALESHPPAKETAIYHPVCYQRMAGQLPDGDSQRVFTEALCAIDGGEGSFAAIEQAAKLVGPGGSLTVLIVTKLRTGIGQMPVDSATELVDRANELADRAGVSCRIEVDPAGPVHQIVSEWASVHDLLAIGAPPKSLLAGMLFSGVTDTAIRSLSTPLLIARPVRAAADFGERMLVASDGACAAPTSSSPSPAASPATGAPRSRSSTRSGGIPSRAAPASTRRRRASSPPASTAATAIPPSSSPAAPTTPSSPPAPASTRRSSS